MVGLRGKGINNHVYILASTANETGANTSASHIAIDLVIAISPLYSLTTSLLCCNK